MPLLRRRPDLSVVVVGYDMARELPRTIASLLPPYQRGVDALDYEILVVDNGSPVPLDPAALGRLDARVRVQRIEDAPPSPAMAANLGVSMTTGKAVCLLLDGARMVTPRLLDLGMRALRTAPSAIVTPMAWHLGSEHQSISIGKGYDAAAEDELLRGIGWPADGYRLFEVAALAGSNKDGFFGTINESCALLLSRNVWTRSGGLDEHFDQPGGGYVSLDLFTRLLELPDSELVVLLGEGSFHQAHGGASTSPGVSLKAWAQHYETLRGRPYRRPPVSPTYYGTLPQPARRWLLPGG